MKERLNDLKTTLPGVIIFASALVAVYMGRATLTEASAFIAAAAVLIGWKPKPKSN